MPSHTSAMLTQIYDFQVELSSQDDFAMCFCAGTDPNHLYQHHK